MDDLHDDLSDDEQPTKSSGRVPRNPYSHRVKKQVTIRLEPETIAYFKAMAEKIAIPYQSLINLYLTDCAVSHRELTLTWD